MLGRWAFAAVYTGSGAAGLIYQVVWTRLLSLHFGHTVAAAGAVLAAFMAGLAGGALAAGRLTTDLDRRRALRVYAAMELFIALAAAALPYALAATGPILAASYGANPGLAFALVRLASSFLLVFLPAAAMGATYPLAIKAVSDDGLGGNRDAGRLYALNTFGAAAGAVIAGFVLVPAIGLSGTTLAGVTLNLAAAAAAWWLARRSTAAADTAGTRPRATAKAAVKPARRQARDSHPETSAPSLAASIACLSGFAALVFEVAFTRALAVALGPTSYAFAAMLAAVITGLAIGATITAHRMWTMRATTAAVTLLLAASAVTAMAAAWFTGTRLPLLLAAAVATPSVRGEDVLTRGALYAVAVLLPYSCALGAVFPLCLRLAADARGPNVGQAARVYGANTLGAIAGALAASFVMIPWLGVHATLRAGAMVTLIAAGLALAGGPLRFGQRVSGAAVAVAIGVALFMVPAWDPNLLSSGAYKYAVDVRDLGLDFDIGLKAGRLLYYREGAAGTVSVRQLAGTLALAIDGKVDASNGTDLLTQKLLAHLPLLLHADPREVCIIGLGSGVTLGAALRHPTSRVDVVEISPEVVDASSLFATENGRALEDARTRLIVGDGRSHLRFTSRRYDVIISEPSNPWMAGVASLFTREFFAAARARLAPGGIICQWAHTYDLAEADLRSIAATFASVFPNGTMWLVGEGDVLFVATNDGPGPVLDNIVRAWRRDGVADDLAKASVFDPFSLLTLYVGGPDEIARYARGASIESDDRPALEFSAPIGLYGRPANENRRRLQALLDPTAVPAALSTAVAAAGASEWRHRAQMSLGVRDYAAAYDDFARGLHLDPEDEQALTGLIDAAGAAQRGDEARTLLESLAGGRPSSIAIGLARARLLAAMNASDEAILQAQAVINRAPADPRGAEALASILADAGQLERLVPLVERMRQARPDRDETWYYAAMASFLAGDLPNTLSHAEAAVRINARHAPALNLIGSASAALGRRDRARQAFQASLAVNPRESTTYANLGLLEMTAGNRDAALAYFVESLSVDPTEAAAREGLTALLAAAPPGGS